VEPNFYPAWKALQRCLKHRNSLLRRDRIDPFELASWDKELVELTNRIHEFRRSCIEKFRDCFAGLITEFINIEGVGIRYFQGWDRETPYSEVLHLGFERDRRLGFTQAGSHRADLKITVKGLEASDVLSRGQQKLLVCALKIAQGYVFSQMTGRRCLYLVDDLPAELDEAHRCLLVRWLNAMETQVFVTGVEATSLLSSWRENGQLNLKMFHVEQGCVTESDLASFI
jgi:DNA replication and repair protein RecF